MSATPKLVDAQAPWRDVSKSISERVRAAVDAMTLSEKLAQLGSFWPRVSSDGHGANMTNVAPIEAAFVGDSSQFHLVAGGGLGHITRTFGSDPVTPAKGVEKLKSMQHFLRDETRLGIPAIAHEECLTGLTALGATVYPAAIAWGASFDPGLIERMAAAIGHDMASIGVHQGLSPLLDVVRDYRWGRVEETCGEDPYLVGSIGTAYVRGLQSQGIIATLKHFAGYSASRAGRNHAPVSMGPREFADMILVSFEMAVREGKVRSVMNSYSDVDGLPAAANHWLLTETLRDLWGFTGTVVSDYGAVLFVNTMHKLAADDAHAAALTIKAGLDIELPDSLAYPKLAALVESGELDVAVVDQALTRVLTQKAELGLLDPGWEVTAADPETIDLDSPSNRALATEVAEKSIILLANPAGVLPVAPGKAKVALIGPVASDPRCMFGCYAFPNHVMARFGDGSLGIESKSILEAAREVFPDLAYTPGCEISGDDTSGIAAAVEQARQADLVILTVGDLAGLFGRGTSGEGCDVQTLQLPGVQAQLADAVLATGTPTVLVAVTGRPYSMGGLADRAAAVVQAFMPGEEGAGALMRVLTGAVNPSGKLPVGIPDGVGGQPATYLAPPLGLMSEGISNLDPHPLFPFGFGLSYTTFEVADLQLDSASIPADGQLTASVSIRNTGGRAGAEVVQLYLSDEVAQVTRPVKQLVGFAKVELQPGQQVRVAFSLHADRTAFTGLDPARRIVEPGWFTLRAGTSSEHLPLEARFEITGTVRDVTRCRVLTTPVSIS